MTTVAGIDLNVLFNALNSELERLGVVHTDLCVIGGSALNAEVGLVVRPTRDVDVVALGTRDGTRLVLSKSRPSRVTCTLRQKRSLASSSSMSGG